MSKGNEKLYFRIEPELHKAMEAQIEMSFLTRAGEPWTVSEFIRVAIAEKLAKMKRSREWRKNKSKVEFTEDEFFHPLDGAFRFVDDEAGEQEAAEPPPPPPPPPPIELDSIERRAMDNLVTHGFPPYLVDRLRAKEQE